MRKRTDRSLIFSAALILCAVIGGDIHAQSGTAPEKNLTALGSESSNPQAGLSLEISLSGNKRQFKPGELISLEVKIKNDRSRSYRVATLDYDWMICSYNDDILITPAESTVNVSELGRDDFCVYNGPGMPNEELKGEFHYTLVINERWRMDRPGKYELKIGTRRVFPDGEGAWVFNGAPIFSNSLTLEMLERDPLWEANTIGRILKELSPKAAGEKPSSSKVKGGSTPAEQQESAEAAATKIEDACRQLRFLGSEAAARELISQYQHHGVCFSHAVLGLSGSPQRALIIQALESLLKNPGYGVSQEYLDMLNRLVFEFEFPGRKSEFFHADVKEQLVIKRHIETLSVAAFEKRGEAMVLSVSTLMNASGSRKNSTTTPWVERAQKEITANFLLLPPDVQEELLVEQWSLIKSPAMIPVLQKLIDNPQRFNNRYSSELEEFALDHLYQLDPQAARTVIISEIKKTGSRIGISHLGVLPETTLPELDEYLLKLLRVSSQSISNADDRGSRQTLLLARFASKAIAADVKSFMKKYESDHGDCSRGYPALLAYFFRVDPPFAVDKLKPILKKYESDTSYCVVRNQLFTRIADSQYSPELEAVAIEALDHPDFEVAGNAALALKLHGSPQVEAKLWKRLEKLENSTQMSEEEKAGWDKNRSVTFTPSVVLQEGLLRALVESDEWLLDLEKMKKLKGMLKLPYQEGFIDPKIRAWEHPFAIQMNIPGEYCVGSNHCYKSVYQLKKRLLQYPKGTTFQWSQSVPDSEGVKNDQAELKKFLNSNGMQLAE